jgi:hypothetical protein
LAILETGQDVARDEMANYLAARRLLLPTLKTAEDYAQWENETYGGLTPYTSILGYDETALRDQVTQDVLANSVYGSQIYQWALESSITHSDFLSKKGIAPGLEAKLKEAAAKPEGEAGYLSSSAWTDENLYLLNGMYL